MADKADVKSGVLSRLRRLIANAIVQDVPSQLAACEFGCRTLECRQNDWKSCSHRIRSAANEGQ